MILLHNQHDEKSRKFLEQNKDKFERVLEYPDCVKEFPNVSRFPAVVVTVPEYIKDNSLWFNVKNTPNYKRIGMIVGDFQRTNHEAQEKCGANSGVEMMDKYIQARGLKDDYKQFLVDLCNDFDVPAKFCWHGVSAGWCYDLGEECKNELDERNKERIISYDLNVPLLGIIPAGYEIIYPEDIKEAEDIISANKEKTDLRTAIYAGQA